MKVGELVERLQRLPLDAEVLVSDGEFCASDTPNLRLDVGDEQEAARAVVAFWRSVEEGKT